jgi:hypothetical protein
MKMTKSDNTAYPTVKDGLRYLTAQGWQISQKTLYRHIEQEKISKNPWSREALDVYAVQLLNPRVDIIPTKKGRQLDPGPAAALLAARKKKSALISKPRNLSCRFAAVNLSRRTPVIRHWPRGL